MALAGFGREVGDVVIVKVLIRGEEVLAPAKLLRLAEHVSQAHLVAVSQLVDPQAQVEQQLTAGDITFLPMFVRGDCMFRDGRSASQVTGMEAIMDGPAPQVDIGFALAAFQAAVEGGFVSPDSAEDVLAGGARTAASPPRMIPRPVDGSQMFRCRATAFGHSAHVRHASGHAGRPATARVSHVRLRWLRNGRHRRGPCSPAFGASLRAATVAAGEFRAAWSGRARHGRSSAGSRWCRRLACSGGSRGGQVVRATSPRSRMQLW